MYFNSLDFIILINDTLIIPHLLDAKLYPPHYFTFFLRSFKNFRVKAKTNRKTTIIVHVKLIEVFD